MLLRADIHALWNLGMITVNPDTGKVMIAEEVLRSCFELEGIAPATPIAGFSHPSKEAHQPNFE
ncbi:hypothetical protein E1H14_09305 [Nitrincola tapanii]|uniref:Uncharacterized protein n=1 Tax=Nitrincola tapanii TaxID=1708751 RepID=A0A5A9W151_9GAMM|nr:hypothetical protein E1H14_09305 [Nitrincola tapanii]